MKLSWNMIRIYISRLVNEIMNEWRVFISKLHEFWSFVTLQIHDTKQINDNTSNNHYNNTITNIIRQEGHYYDKCNSDSWGTKVTLKCKDWAYDIWNSTKITIM